MEGEDLFTNVGNLKVNRVRREGLENAPENPEVKDYADERTLQIFEDQLMQKQTKFPNPIRPKVKKNEPHEAIIKNTINARLFEDVYGYEPSRHDMVDVFNPYGEYEVRDRSEETKMNEGFLANYHERMKVHKIPYQGFQRENVISDYRLNESIADTGGQSGAISWAQRRRYLMNTERRNKDRVYLQKNSLVEQFE